MEEDEMDSSGFGGKQRPLRADHADWRNRWLLEAHNNNRCAQTCISVEKAGISLNIGLSS